MNAAPRRYLIVAARRLPAAFVCHRYLIVVPRPFPAAPFLRQRDAAAPREEHSADEQRSRVNMTSLMCTEAT
jgi:hypothetical protein